MPRSLVTKFWGFEYILPHRAKIRNSQTNLAHYHFAIHNILFCEYTFLIGRRYEHKDDRYYMRDTSIFKGIKELNGLRFKDFGSCWLVYKLVQNQFEEVYLQLGFLKKIKRESNKILYQRALEAILNSYEAKYGRSGM